MPDNSSNTDDHSDDESSNSISNSNTNSNLNLNLNPISNIYDVFDAYGNIVDASFNNQILFDASGNLIDSSFNNISGVGFEIINENGIDASGNVKLHTQFISTEPDIYDPNITEKFVEYVSVYNDIADPTNENTIVMNQIIEYASKIKCEDFHGKGTIDDYSELFKAASKIATETKQIQLDVDIDGFNEFGQAADELANLFTSFTLRLQNVNIINDLDFLKAISNALEKIYNLSEIFGKFKETILTTTNIQLPKSSHDTKIILDNVMSEVNCAMKYITNFVEPVDLSLFDYQLSSAEQNIISNAVSTIDNWNIICQQGVSIAMTTNPDIQSINNTNQLLKTKTIALKNATLSLKNKLLGYMTI